MSPGESDLAAWQLDWLEFLAAARDIVVATVQVRLLLNGIYIGSTTNRKLSLQMNAALPGEADPELERSQTVGAIRFLI